MHHHRLGLGMAYSVSLMLLAYSPTCPVRSSHGTHVHTYIWQDGQQQETGRWRPLSVINARRR